jgi:hypothetical protein
MVAECRFCRELVCADPGVGTARPVCGWQWHDDLVCQDLMKPDRFEAYAFAYNEMCRRRGDPPRYPDLERVLASSRQPAEIVAFVDAVTRTGHRGRLVVELPTWMFERYRQVRPAQLDVSADRVVRAAPTGAGDEILIRPAGSVRPYAAYLAPVDLTDRQAEVYAALRTDGADLETAATVARVV